MIAKLLSAGAAVLLLFWMGSVWAAESHEGLVQFEGQWLEPAEAAKREEVRYRKQRVDAPREIAIEVDAGQFKKLRARRDLAVSLTAILRVGDRLLVQQGNQHWRFWKRHRTLTSEFRQAADALRKGIPMADDWAADPVASLKPEAIGEDPLIAIAFALHASRNAFPHADLKADQLPATGLTVKRIAEDGSLTVLVDGASNFKVKTGKLSQAGQLIVVSAAPGNESINFTWSKPPRRLLAIGDSAIPLVSPAGNVVLMKNEKHIVYLTEAKNVIALHRYSNGPDYTGWQQQRFTVGGPLGFQLDMRRDEVGPHQASGTYRRVWILEFGGAEGKPSTQRQVGMSYRVSGEDKDAQSREFLRR